MNDFENQLRALQRSAPSTDLDRRMEQLFSGHRQTQPRPVRFGLWWSLTTAIAISGATALLVISTARLRRTEEAEQVMVRRAGPDDPIRALLVVPSAEPPPRLLVQVSSP